MGFGSALAEVGLQNAEKQEVTTFLSTGNPILDHRLSGKYVGGGFAGGRIIEVIGPSSSGKTIMATNAMIQTQKMGGLAGFDDHERSFDLGLGKSLGLSDSADNWVYSTPFTFEGSLDRMKEKVLIARGMKFDAKADNFVRDPKLPEYFSPDVPFCWVFDSLAAMVPQSALVDAKTGEVKDAADRSMHDNMALARCTSAHFPQLAKFAEATNTCIIFLNQVRTDPNKRVMPGRPNMPDKAPGGGAPEFYATQRVRLGRSFITDDKQSYRKVGQTIACEVFKNKIVAPFQSCEWDLLFQPDGSAKFDIVGGVIDELKALGLIVASGAYLTWTDGKKYYRSQLIDKIEKEGLESELMALLPV